jgi:peptidoglycan hydrolase-like protein with peptidoglycan-binding domain
VKPLRHHLSRRRLFVGVGLLVVLAAVGVAVADPFAGSAAGRDPGLDNGSPTSIGRVERTSLSSQTPVSGTLGYAGSWTVSVPAVSAYGGAAIYTKLPSTGDVVSRGQRLYAIDGQAVLLLYGSTPAWRVFHVGMSSGPDVAELNANLRALGYGAPRGNGFTSATAAAVSRLQRAQGLAATGMFLLGAVVFEPGPLRVTAVTPTVGQPVAPGPLLTASSTRHSVAVQLDTAQESQVKVGDRVTVTLPGSRTTPGVVSSVGKVATFAPSDQGGGASGPTIEVSVRLLHPAAAGTLDQAPVDVSITGASVRNVLAVPVNALLALAGGGYAVEEVDADGGHRLVAVRPGLFDDGQGLVEISGAGLAVGERVVVPAK